MNLSWTGPNMQDTKILSDKVTNRPSRNGDSSLNNCYEKKIF